MTKTKNKRKKENTTNRQAELTVDQIENTLILLERHGLLIDRKKSLVSGMGDKCRISWQNHERGRQNCGEYFTSLEQYAWIIDKGAYQGLLFDGSIIRVSFLFDKNILKEENLLYWPSPIQMKIEDIEEYGIYDVLYTKLFQETEALIPNKISSEVEFPSTLALRMKMRSPIRLDYDSNFEESEQDDHPATHLHFQDSECRLAVQKPCCFNTFIHFILNNFYSRMALDILKDLKPLFYSGYKDNDTAPLAIPGLKY